MAGVSIVGVRGYAGGELLRLLLQHPAAEVCSLYGRSSGETGSVEEALPHIGGPAVIRPLEALQSDDAEIIFLSVPADAAQALAPELLAQGHRVIDLSGGHRLPQGLYPQWYGIEPQALPPAVYGLTEYWRSDVASADLVANPGCYATALLLGLLPLVEA
ncbi:N-acetyl-gamma-glutamyl-phosphate reductase, partial [mine drainage metagenome]